MTYPPPQEPVDPALMQYGIYTNVPLRNHSLALPALIVGIISLGFLIGAFALGSFNTGVCLILGLISLVIGIVAVVLGEIARKGIKARPNIYKGGVMAIIGEVCGSISIGLALAMLIMLFFYVWSALG